MVSVARCTGFCGAVVLRLWFCICGGFWRDSVACGALAVTLLPIGRNKTGFYSVALLWSVVLRFSVAVAVVC